MNTSGKILINHLLCVNTHMLWEMVREIWRRIIRLYRSMKDIVADLYGNGVIMQLN